MKKVLVTGANGYIGKQILPALVERDIQVVAVDIRKEPHDVPVEFIEGNLFDPSFDLLSVTGPVDACLHLAWRSGFDHGDIAHMSDLSAHYLFLRKLIEGGVPKVAVMGSMHEVGYFEGAVDENTPCNPQSFYGIAKDALRRAFLLEAAKHSTKAQWLRAFYIIGEDVRSQSIFGKLMRAAQNGEKTFPFTTGKNKYDFIDVGTLAQQISSCVAQDEIAGIINCCSGSPVSLADKVEQFIADNDLDIRLEYGVYPDRPYDSPAIWGDASKIDQIMSKA